MDKDKGVKIPVQLRVNMWFGLSAHEKKFNSFSEGNFSVYAEMVQWLHRAFAVSKIHEHNSNISFVSPDFIAHCVEDCSKMQMFSLCSMRTRLRGLESGEPTDWLVAISSQT